MARLKSGARSGNRESASTETQRALNTVPVLRVLLKGHRSELAASGEQPAFSQLTS